ncbi:MAG: DUF1289 domain-containing protein [Gallionellaceae bacterium]|nr:MAG: DUF1289 domain-containing protein [Gallionellaceae bacterium]
MACTTLSAEVTADSPCSGHCTTVLGDDVCRSCHRTFEEITRWVAMSEEERCAVNQRIATLRTAQLKHLHPSLLPEGEGAIASSPLGRGLR